MNDRILDDGLLSVEKVIGEEASPKLTGQTAEKRLLLGVAAHMGLERIATGMHGALARALAPLARVLCPLGRNVVVLDVLDQVVAVAQVADRTPLPLTRRDLVGAQGVLVVRGRPRRAAFAVLGEVNVRLVFDGRRRCSFVGAEAREDAAAATATAIPAAAAGPSLLGWRLLCVWCLDARSRGAIRCADFFAHFIVRCQG